jgi:hypothetical protein
MPLLVQKELVNFDPKSRAHLIAYRQLRTSGRQTELRFSLDKEYDNVVTMMNHKIIEEYLQNVS